ncbi:unnamed protein product, partial [Prorocentrum cordatum]
GQLLSGWHRNAGLDAPGWRGCQAARRGGRGQPVPAQVEPAHRGGEAAGAGGAGERGREAAQGGDGVRPRPAAAGPRGGRAPRRRPARGGAVGAAVRGAG